MSTEQQQPVTAPSTVDDGAEWGAGQQPAPKGKRSAKKVVIAVAIALGIAGAGAGVVYAASGSTSSSTEQGPGGSGGGMGGPGGQQGDGPGGMGALSQALHGEYVVSDGSGSYTTEVIQNGEVTAISDTSITAKSEDGYTETYTIDADAVSADLSDIATGDDVTIIATVSGDTATVESVVEEGAATGQMGQAPPGQSTDGTSQDSSGN